jgi:hypothetical protein
MPSVPDEGFALILLLKNIQHARKQVKIILELKNAQLIRKRVKIIFYRRLPRMLRNEFKLILQQNNNQHDSTRAQINLTTEEHPAG